jgi:hypothetical protein
MPMLAPPMMLRLTLPPMLPPPPLSPPPPKRFPSASLMCLRQARLSASVEA